MPRKKIVIAQLRDPVARYLSDLPAYALCWLLLSLAYVIIFLQTSDLEFGSAMRAAFANVLPPSLLGLLMSRYVMPPLEGRRLTTQLLAHATLAPLFSAVWLASVIGLLAISRMFIEGAFEFRPFTPSATGWQAFQGLLVYTAIACGLRLSRLSSVQRSNTKQGSLSRYLLRVDDELVAFDVSEIVAIRGADDYSEVVTRRGAHLVRLSLSAFADRLTPEQFLRIDRSLIINLDRLQKAEPAGNGQLVLHFDGGISFDVGRSAAKAIRSRLM